MPDFEHPGGKLDQLRVGVFTTWSEAAAVSQRPATPREDHKEKISLVGLGDAGWPTSRAYCVGRTD